MSSETHTPDAQRSPAPPRRRRSTGTYAAADARREAIAEAATACFAQSGYLSSSLAQIAADAGTSATVVLHHFGSKERLLMAVLLRHESRTRERLTELREQGRLNSLQALLDSALEQTAYNLAHPGRLQLFVKLSAEAGDPGHPAHAYFVQRYRDAAELLSDAVRTAVGTGEVRPDTDAEQVAQELMAVSDGLQVQWALDQDRFDLPGGIFSYYDRLSRAVSVSGKGLNRPNPQPD